MNLADHRSLGARLFGCAAKRALSTLSTAMVLVASAAADPFYMGGDISLESFMQDEEVVFYDNDVAKPMDRIMYDHGANLFRLRVFVEPETVYTDDADVDVDNPNYGAIQTRDYVIDLAQQIKANAPNAKILLDFHYSDTWADPGDQTRPAGWSSSLATLKTTVQNYTHDTLMAFHAAGVMPEMVQVGNEISNGLLWETGRVNHTGLASWVNAGSLLRSAIQGVRMAEVDTAGSHIDVAIHIDKGDQDDHPQYYFQNLMHPSGGNVTDFDIVGVSYYPSTQPFHSFALLQENLNAIADTYPTKKIMMLETNYAWQSQGGIGIPTWTETPAGQKQFLTDVTNMMRNLHNDAGAGVVWWFPEAVYIPGRDIHLDGSIALFNASHNPTPALSVFHVTLTPGDFNHDGYVDAADYTVWRNNVGDLTEMDITYSGDGLNGVDAADYAIWKQNYGTTPDAGGGGLAGAPSSQRPVPEPASFLLLLAGLAIVHRRAR